MERNQIDPRDERIVELERENARLVRAWEAKHKRQVEAEKEVAMWFEQAQKAKFVTQETKTIRISELEAALEPFAIFGANNVDEVGWSGREQQAPITTWFGPSDFRRARDVLGTRPDTD